MHGVVGRSGLLQGRDVIQDVDAAAISRKHYVVELLLHRDPSDRRVRQAGLQRSPIRTVVERIIKRVAGSGEQQPLAIRIFGNGAHVA